MCSATARDSIACLATARHAGGTVATGLAVADPALTAEWEGLKPWVIQRLGFPFNYVWDAAVARSYPDDAVAFEQLPLLYRGYRAEMAGGSGSAGD